MKKSLSRITALAVMAVAVSACPLNSYEKALEMKVGVFIRVASVTLGPGEYAVRNPQESKSKRVTVSRNLLVTAGPLGLVFDGKNVGKHYRVDPARPDGRLAVNGRPFRGALELHWRKDGALTAVNVIDMDDYVRGILTRETNPDWPIEALKAQAVASRTYALRHRGRHSTDGFDVCADVHCQVYGGMAAERVTTDKAVADTRGQILVYQGGAINAVFHSCCGGHTEMAENVWSGTKAPYLKSVRCRYCRTCPKFLWRYKITREELSKRLAADGHDVGLVKNIKILSRSRSNRVHELRVEGAKGRATLNSNLFRLAVGARELQSTLWSALSRESGGWLFIGHGWGHGVGMCQWGAKGMADEGNDFKRIVRFYYPGASVGRYERKD